MDWSREVQKALAAPFPADEIEFLPRASAGGRALALAHIDARSVMRRLDEVVGAEGWQFDFECQTPDGKKVKGILSVLGVTKCDAGEAAAEDEPLKAAVSDALKRCGVHFGIARYLYYLPQMWVPYDAAKRRFTETPSIAPRALTRALAVCGWHGEVPAGVEVSVVAGGRAGELESEGRSGRAGGWVNRETGEVTGERPPANGRWNQPENEVSNSAAEMFCNACEKALTKGQRDVSMRAFGRMLCPDCQRKQARSA